MRIMLIDGAETYHCAGAPILHLGVASEIPDDIARHLLAERCPTGPMFLAAGDIDRRPVALRLADHCRDYSSPAVTIQGAEVRTVPASVVPYLLRRRWADGSPVFVRAD